jgi:parallel beta-helix repeat protein
METLHSVHQSFLSEIQNLHGMGKDIEDLKFTQDSMSVNCRTTSQRVEALENKVAELSIENQEVPYLFMLPDRTEWFSGRKSELENLHSLLRDVNEHEVKVASVCWLGGIGKTSLAAEYAYRWKYFYDGGVFWFSGEDESKFANSVDDHAVCFGTLLEASPGRTLVKTLEVISTIQKPWLLLLDDMDEFKLCSNIGMLLSGPWKGRVKGRGHILITTRREPKVTSQSIPGFKESQCLQLECFSLEDGNLFVCKRTGISSDDGTSAEAVNLVENLGGLPLALEQACAYISHLSCSLSEYLQQYEKYSIQLLDEQDASSASLYGSRERLAVRTRWLVNFEYIKQSKNGHYSVRFLHACAFFDPTEIQQELTNSGKPPIEDDPYRDYVDTLLGSSHILKLLTDFSLFKKNKCSSLTLHRLVQEVIREKLKSDHREMEILSLVDAISMLSFAFSKCPSPDDLSISDIDLHHQRSSLLVTNPSLFYSWKKLCLHAHEVLIILNSFQILDENILKPETARIVYECALDFNISSETDKASQCMDFANKIVDLGSTRLTEDDLASLFPHQVPMPESVRRYIFYSCVKPSDTVDSITSDGNSKVGSKSKMEQMHFQGNVYSNNGDFHKAIEIYSAAMTEVSSFVPKLLCDRAEAYINLQQYKQALVDSESYLLQCPNCWLGFAVKALALDGLNKIWEASSFAALAFYHNRNIFCDYQPFNDMFSTLKGRIYICNRSDLLTDFLLKPLSDSGSVSGSPGKIIMVEPGDYLVDVDHPVTPPFFLHSFSFTKGLLIDDCILLGVDNLNSSVVVRFGSLVSTSGRRFMAANVSFVFSTGNWESKQNSITTWLNCSFTSSSEKSEHTFLSFGTDTFRNCFFQNSESPGLSVMGKTDVEECVFSGGEYSGVHVSTGGYLEIKESKLHGNEFGMYIAHAIEACNIINCDIFDNKCHGIYVTDKALNVRVENCRIYQNDRNGISVDNASFAFISSNEIFENEWHGIATLCNGRCTVSRNKIYGNKSGGVQVVPVYSREGRMSPSIVEFNEISHNRGHAIYWEFVAEGTQSDVGSRISNNVSEQVRHYQRNSKYYRKAMCNGNNFYNKTDSTIVIDYCFSCLKKCFKKCIKCFVTTYCNEECQKRDWRKHKKECHSILARSTVRVNISPNKGVINLEHLESFPFSFSQHPTPAPKGLAYAKQPTVGERFLVKVLAADETWHSNSEGPLFTICDRSLTVNGCLNKTCYPQLYNIVRECGVSSTLIEGWKKKFFWAQFHGESCGAVSVFITKFPQPEDW